MGLDWHVRDGGQRSVVALGAGRVSRAAPFFAHLFKNWPKDQFGTKVPISGTFDNPKVGILEAVLGAFRNALIKPLKPKVDETVEPEKPREPTGRERSKAVDGRK